MFCRLVGNPVCEESGATGSYCTPPQPNVQYTTPFIDCEPTACQANAISSPKCQCAYPYMGTLYFRAPSFSDLGNATTYEALQNTMLRVLQTNQVPVDSISLKNPTKNLDDYLVLSLAVFPSGVDRFNRTGISRTGFMLSNQTFKPPHGFGPFYFRADAYKYFPGNAVFLIIYTQQQLSHLHYRILVLMYIYSRMHLYFIFQVNLLQTLKSQ